MLTLVLIQTSMFKLSAQLTASEAKSVAIEFMKSYIHNTYNGGINQRVYVNSYKEDDYEIRINIDMSWNGDFITSNYYQESGTLIFTRDIYDNMKFDYRSTYRNETARNYRGNINMLIAGTAAIVAVNEFSKH